MSRRALFDDHLDMIPRVLRRRWRQAQFHDWQDLKQAGAIGLLEATRRADLAADTFPGLAKRCIHGAAVDQWRREHGRGEKPPTVELVEFIDPRMDPTEEVHVGMIREDLLRELPERTRLMAQLYFFEGESAVAIGRRFRVTDSMVFRLLRPVRDRLRELLAA